MNRFFNITYTKDTIIIDVVDNGQVISDKYYCKKGEYYDYKDSNLYFSTKREMEFKYSIGAAEYSIQIKKEGENYKTSVYLISPELGAVFLSAFFYDKQYRIYKIERSQTVEFY